MNVRNSFRHANMHRYTLQLYMYMRVLGVCVYACMLHRSYDRSVRHERTTQTRRAGGPRGRPARGDVREIVTNKQTRNRQTVSGRSYPALTCMSGKTDEGSATS